METLAQNPCQWRLSTLLSLETEQVHKVACWAAGSLTSFHLVLGRCLLALHESKGYKAYGCSTAVHYGSSVLGVSTRVARECKRVADRLQNLPCLTLAAERGKLPWGKLREVVRVAAPETEEYWLKLCGEYESNRIQRLVSMTPVGHLPGDTDIENTCTTEFRIAATPELIQMFRRARRMFSLELDQNVSGAETLECLLAAFFSTQALDSTALEEARREADKELQAERARQIPEVIEAREKAEELGLLGGAEDVPGKESTIEELLSEAIGTSSCDWRNTRLRFNPQSRHTTKAQRLELLRRDGWCCSTPGCPNRTWIHIHHIAPYSEGGPTAPENLICLCSGCHRNLHDGHLKITPTDTGRFIFTDEHGRNLERQADLEMAAWLDFRMGWRGKESNSHQSRALSGEWAVFGAA